MIIENLKLHATENPPVQIINATQGETNARVLYITIFNGAGAEIPLNGKDVYLYVEKTDGNIVEETGTLQENQAVFTLHTQAMTCPGKNKMFIQVSDISKPEILRVDGMVLNVEECKADKAVPSETVLTSLQTATINANNAADSANTAATNANNATKNATDAIGEANTATTNANTAAINANNEATVANAAATGANSAADNANNKAGEANTAATNANNATTAANSAATKANNAADEAKKYVDSVTLTSIGAAPAGYGMGEILWDNMIKDPLDTSLKTGVYGMWDGLEGFTNFPETNFVGYCEIHNFNNEWHSAIAHNLVSGEIFYNLYAPGIPWSGWVRTSTKVIDLPPVSHPETVTLKAPNDAPMVFQKCGNHVILNEYLNFSTNLSSWGTIPEGLRPKKLVVFQIAHNNGNAYIGIAPPSGMLYSDQMIPAGVLAYNLDYYI